MISSTRIDLTWSKSPDGDYTVIRYSTTGYPTSPSEGILIYNNTGSSYSHTGLTVGTKYYYSAWAYNSTTNQYSTSYITATNTTNALPTITDTYPPNGSVGIDFQPRCRINITDTNGGTLNIYCMRTQQVAGY